MDRLARHAQIRIETPKRNGTSTLVDVDEGIAQLILDVWSLEGPGGFCRTYASCQGGKHNGYLMYQAGFGHLVAKVIDSFGFAIVEVDRVDNSFWAPGVWEVIYWTPKETL